VFDAAADAVDNVLWIAPFACHFVEAKAVAKVKPSIATTIALRRIRGASAPNAAAAATTVVELVQGTTVDLNSVLTNHTVYQIPLLSTVSGDSAVAFNRRVFIEDDKLAIDFGSAATDMINLALTFTFKRL
jgi:hypothetical protein